MRQHFMMFAAYNQWANRRLYDAAAELGEEELRRDMGAFFGSMLGTLNHILVADRVWMKRFTGQGDAPAALDTILHGDFPALRAAREAEDLRILDWVAGLDEKAMKGRFTYMTVDMKNELARRAYTSDAANYPTSGTKPIHYDDCFDIVHKQHAYFVANTIDDIAKVFPDHELINSLRCQSVVNMPVLLGGELVGSVNMLHEAGYYTPERVAEIKAVLSIPAKLAAALAR